MNDSAQLSWQRRAHAVLGRLLDLAAREKLPPADWTIGSAGAVLTGRCFQPDPAGVGGVHRVGEGTRRARVPPRSG